MKNWVISSISDNGINDLYNELGVHEIIAKLLIARGINKPEDINKFMNPSLDDLHDPFLLKDMDKAVDRIILAIAQKEKILIYGDYDVDGTTSSSILYRFFKRLDLEVEVYIPSRFEEGYGLSMAAVDKIKDNGCKLIITVDCGISSIAEVDELNNLGFDIIITDHHQCQEELPKAIAVINPHREDSDYPFKELCGVGVAFKLISALSTLLKIQGFAEEFIDTVALGTVADIVPLIDENRVFVYHGLRKMNDAPCIGISALLDIAGLKGKNITSYSVAFGLAPRINAAGRLGDAMRAVNLLTAENEAKAKELAMELNSENMLRQQTEGEILNEVIEYIEKEHDFARDKVIVASGINWHHGVIGIVASKVVEKYYRPCILLCNEDGVLRGSGRSIDGFNIFNALTYCKDLLEKYGGHEMAAGLTIESSKLREFNEQINIYANDNIKSGDLIEKIHIDAILEADNAKLEIATEVKQLAPFGQGNSSPVFVCKDFRIHSMRKIGEDKHLKLIFSAKEKLIEAIAFNMGALADTFKIGDIVDIVCSLDINSYNNVDKVQLVIKDIRLCEKEFVKDSFYSTVDNTIMYEKLALESSPQFDKLERIDFQSLVDTVNKHLSNGEMCLFLVNDVEAIKEVTYFLNNLDNKPTYKINIGDYLEERDINLYIIVNPSVESAKSLNQGNVFIFGRWIDQIYLEAIVNSIDNGRGFLYNNKLGVSIFDGTGFDREDIKAIYKFIWAVPGKVVMINDLNKTTTEVNSSYNRFLKAYSFKKCLEVLDEVGLINTTFLNAICVKVEKNDNRGKKVDLENSRTYQKIHTLLN